MVANMIWSVNPPYWCEACTTLPNPMIQFCPHVPMLWKILYRCESKPSLASSFGKLRQQCGTFEEVKGFFYGLGLDRPSVFCATFKYVGPCVWNGPILYIHNTGKSQLQRLWNVSEPIWIVRLLFSDIRLNWLYFIKSSQNAKNNVDSIIQYFWNMALCRFQCFWTVYFHLCLVWCRVRFW